MPTITVQPRPQSTEGNDETLRADGLRIPEKSPTEPRRTGARCENEEEPIGEEERKRKQKEAELLEKMRAKAEEAYALHNDPVRLNENTRVTQERADRERVQDRRLRRRQDAAIGRSPDTIEM